MATREVTLDELEVVSVEPSDLISGYTARTFDVGGMPLVGDIPPVLEYTFKPGDHVDLYYDAVEAPYPLVAIRINDGPRIPLHYDRRYMLRPFL
jgi:hypothetical protein